LDNQVQGIMGIAKRKRASAPVYVSPNQLTIEGFQTPFDQQLAKDNRWVVLANLIPWDEVCAIYLKHVGVSSTGRAAISPRVVIGSLIIKHLGNL
jgi:transposase, IS5 family